LKKQALFTFDYELFLGKRSGTVERCMIAPTNSLLRLFKKNNIQGAIFFVDTTYLLQLKVMSVLHKKAKDDFELIKSQLQNIISSGHYVFPHIHPHWLDAQYNVEINQWELNNLSKYRFHNISESERDELFKKSIDLLNEIILPIKKDYQINAYRAGGWCIQPFDDFKPYFLKHEIRFDFSVLKGFAQYSNAQYYNFIDFPESNIYRFNNDPKNEEYDGNFFEFAISSVNKSKIVIKLEYFLSKILWKLNRGYFGDGIGVIPDKTDSTVNVRVNNKEMVSIENFSVFKLYSYFKILKKDSYVQFISHPKMVSKHNLFCFGMYLKLITLFKGVETDYRKMV
jgi:hypothetical protein